MLVGMGLIYLAGCQKAVSEHTFHTSPDRWEKPRVFQTSAEDSTCPFSNKVSVEKYDDIVLDDTEKIYSPNDAYWFQKRFSEKGTFQVVIFNEHRFIVIDTSGDDHYAKEVRWINEKLIYVRDWLGKVLGLDVIYDVEKEEILYFEMVHDGGLPFLQWQQNKISISN